ncbi:MAG TPA: helix-turn-helix domain-containing protein [Gemmatimonadales bacterium]|nr:helix-turn-helix domain-containing protein [Gemmatimonadales bacterium]
MTIATQYIDTDFGRWVHTEWRPGPQDPLAWAVERVWDFDGMASAPQERVFPNGLVELIVQLDDRYHDVLESGCVLTPVTCVTGVFSGPMVVQAPRRRCRVLGVRLHPAGAWIALRHPLSALADTTADLEQLLGGAASELAERCHDAPSGVERVRRAVAWLSTRTRADGSGLDPSIHRIARQIAATAGSRPVGPLRLEAGLSDTRLVALFRQQVGVTPKRYANIHRFAHALSLLSRPGASLAGVALAAGYYDQPHMNAEFRRMARLTPGDFLAARRFPNSLSLPEPV